MEIIKKIIAKILGIIFLLIAFFIAIVGIYGFFDMEMDKAHFTNKQKELMHKHCDQYWGCCALQEQMMELLMEILFTLYER